MIKKIIKTDSEWKKILAPEQFKVMRQKETEHPFTCGTQEIKAGIYYCAACGLPLFNSQTKFESGTGWPSYFAPVSTENIQERPDNSFAIRRTEVICAQCESHLGHVFNDGPPPTHKRYCINSIALKFTPRTKTAVLGGGCFWCQEALFLHIKGVISVESGYAGGELANPTYEQVSSGKSGHAEVIKIDYDPSIISFRELLYIFFYAHDPTTKDRQGGDIGHQYRSIILYADKSQKEIAEEVIKELEAKKAFKKPIVTEVAPLENFYKAEEYHQRYFEKNPQKAYCQVVIAPKIKKLEKEFLKYYQP